jgi:hypothetical protein
MRIGIIAGRHRVAKRCNTTVVNVLVIEYRNFAKRSFAIFLNYYLAPLFFPLYTLLTICNCIKNIFPDSGINYAISSIIEAPSL